MPLDAMLKSQPPLFSVCVDAETAVVRFCVEQRATDALVKLAARAMHQWQHGIDKAEHVWRASPSGVAAHDSADARRSSSKPFVSGWKSLIERRSRSVADATHFRVSLLVQSLIVELKSACQVYIRYF